MPTASGYASQILTSLCSWGLCHLPPMFEPHTYSYSYKKNNLGFTPHFPTEIAIRYPSLSSAKQTRPRCWTGLGSHFGGEKTSSRQVRAPDAGDTTNEPSDTARGPRKSVLQGILRRRRISTACGTSVVNGSACQNDHSISILGLLMVTSCSISTLMVV